MGKVLKLMWCLTGCGFGAETEYLVMVHREMKIPVLDWVFGFWVIL